MMGRRTVWPRSLAGLNRTGFLAGLRMTCLVALLASLTACTTPDAATSSYGDQAAAADAATSSYGDQAAAAGAASQQPDQPAGTPQPAEAPASSAAASPSTAPATPAPTPKPGTVTVVPILMYHYIRDLPPNTRDVLGYRLSIAPKVFEQQLQYLAGAGYTSVSMAQVTDHILYGTALPPKPIVLTFDDGYADFYTTAWPLLQQYHFNATTYLVVDFLGKPGYMSWMQAEHLRDAGVEIGAHTMDHVDLSIQPPASARHQIADSGAILRQRLNAPVTTFAYPSGQYNANTVKIVGESGFTSAVTTAFGSRHTASTLLTMSRVRVQGGDSMPNFVKNLSA
jgi:peptidoglycan/xylan/chitin deacetylase (PgdA/CDA1 family)